MTREELRAMGRNIGLALGLVAILALTWLVYQPGVGGAFLFDDFSNLSQLGAYGTIDNWESFWLYLLSGFSGPTGRPLSMLSFLLDARDWPADPASFKHTNVIIHLITGGVLFALARQLALALGYRPRQAGGIALFSAALWLLHPFWVSTTLYAVQRMAQLSTLFVLLGLWLYVRVRVKQPPSFSLGLAVGSTVAIGLFGLLAVLSKENGALLPALAIIAETTVLAIHDQQHGLAQTKAFKYWRFFLLGVPTLLLCGYLLTQVGPLLAGDPGLRVFTPWERLLTEGRILWDYVAHILIPRPYSGGLFNDDIELSTGFFMPWTTALAWASWLILAVWAWKAREKHPALALAILFFLAAHTLESSFLQLELYFEHRNYLPAALLGFPLAIAWATSRMRPINRQLVAAGTLLVLAVMTGMRAELWGSPFEQALTWSRINPESSRAHHFLATKWRETRNYSEAERLNKKSKALAPKSLLPHAQSVALNCQQGKPADKDIRHIEQILARKQRIGAVDRHYVAQMFDLLLAGSCGNSSDPGTIVALIRRMEDQPNATTNPAYASLLAQRVGVAFLQLGEPQAALEHFHDSARLTPGPGPQLRNAATLASHGAYSEALVLLDDIPRSKQAPTRTGIAWARAIYNTATEYYEKERLRLRRRIVQDYQNETSMASR